MTSLQIFKPQKGESFYISPEGMKQILSNPLDEKYPARNIIWTDHINVQLPIRLQKEGIGSVQPTTLIDQVHKVVKEGGQLKALSVKRHKKWQTLTYNEYYQKMITFARSLIAYNIKEGTTINIIGFNSPEWNITFMGSLFAKCLPVGVYTTNNIIACQYIARHSQCRVVIADTLQAASKYEALLQSGEVKYIIVYNEPHFKTHSDKILQWSEFMKAGQRVEIKYVEQRSSKIRPGHCCTLIYTSGTTGMPKGVMLSHDNYTWTKKSMNTVINNQKRKDPNSEVRMVSYLPLSHVAAQFSDIISALIEKSHLYFADPMALQGTLIETLLEVRPNIFFSVPRVWQKIYDKMKDVAKNNGYIKTKIATWAKSIGVLNTIREMQMKDTSYEYKFAKILVYQPVKKALGLDQCQLFLFGAAPLDPAIRAYFLSLGIPLINSYGMSQSTGPNNFTTQDSFSEGINENIFRQVGNNLAGTELKIVKVHSSDDNGEICFKGRNRFMGYYKNPEETNRTIDHQGFLHSGDQGYLNKYNILFITGRIKQLIITAGGENIPPLMIQHQLKIQILFVSNIMVVGEGKKYLSCLICLKEDPPMSGYIEKTALEYLNLKGFQGRKISEACESKIVKKLISEGIKKANDKAISKAQYINNFHILDEDFSVENGLLTPTLKLKRKQVLKKYAAEIAKMYVHANL